MISTPKTTLFSLLICCYLPQVLANNEGEDLNTVPIKESTRIADSKLLLPGSYRKYFPSLQRAAQLAVDTEQCERFLQGGLQLDRSAPDHPVFRILCRNEQGRSYALLVDGLSFHLLDDTRPDGSISFAELQKEKEWIRERQRILDEKSAEEALAEAKRLEDLELLRAAEELVRLEAKRKIELWEHCLQELKPKVQNMHALVWLTIAMPEPKVDTENRLSYDIDFDAEDIHQQPLRYRAVCLIQEKTDFSLVIRPRRDLLNNK